MSESVGSCIPPVPAGPTPPISLNRLWKWLAVSQRQQLCSVLSELVAHRLLTVVRKEAADEAR